jgi:hypothetical protein
MVSVNDLLTSSPNHCLSYMILFCLSKGLRFLGLDKLLVDLLNLTLGRGLLVL